MTLSQIEILVELSNEGSFTRVAEKLGITQPAVSLAVKKLETELDTIIISREHKSFALTETGQNILIYGRQIVKQVRNIKSEVLNSKNGAKGKLILGTVWSVNNTLLPKIINSFKREHSEIDISIFEGIDQEIEDWLLNGTVDIGISGWDNNNLVQEKLTEDNYLVVTPKKHPLSVKKVVEVHELRFYPLISSKTGCEPLIRSIADYHQVELKLKYQAKEILTILSMVKENLGISIFPELAIPKGFNGVEFIPLNTPIKRKIYVGYKKGKKPIPVIELFMNHISNEYKRGF